MEHVNIYVLNSANISSYFLKEKPEETKEDQQKEEKEEKKEEKEKRLKYGMSEKEDRQKEKP